MKRKSLFFKIISVLFICTFLSNVSFSETGKTDSLRNVISKLEDKKEIASVLLKIGDAYNRIDYDSALYYFQKANELSSSIGDFDGLADSWYKQFSSYYYMKSYDSAERMIEKFIDASTSLNDSTRIEKGYYLYGFLLKDMSLNELGINYAKRSVNYSHSQSDPQIVIGNYTCLGIMFKNISQYDSAAIYLLKALAISENNKDDIRAANILNNLGDVYSQAEYYEKAQSYYEKALGLNQELPGRELSIALNFNNLGRLESARENYAKAREYYDKSMVLFSGSGDSSGIFDIYNNYGDLYYKQEKYELAKEYFTKALDGYKRSDHPIGMVTGYGNLTAVNLMLRNIKEGMAMHDSCLKLTFIIGNRDLRMDAYWNVASLFSEIGNYEKSHKFLMKYVALKDSIYDLKRSKFTYDLVAKYEKEKNDARILTLEKENLQKTIQRNYVLYGSLGILLLALFGFLYLRQRAVKDRIITHQKIRQLEEEKKLMVAKMIVEGQEEERKRIARELHDGLGVLLSATKMQFTTIKDNSPENRPMIEKAIKLLEQASGDVRKISHNMMPGLLTKLGFFEAIEDLFDNLNDASNMEAVLEISGSQERMPENREIMLYRIVQEMVNNTLKHAEATRIKLRIDVMTDQIVMVFADNGKGFNAEKILQSDTSSLGLKSIQSRVNFLSGEVEIESHPGEGVKYIIQLPIS